MIRLIVRVDDATMAANVPGGVVHTTYKTFDINSPEIENYIRSFQHPNSVVDATVVGAELLPKEPIT